MDCQKCGACCAVLSYPAPTRTDIEFFKARGFKILDGEAWILHPCPNLEINQIGESRCIIYEDRPLFCRSFKQGCRACIQSRKFLEVD